MALNITRGVVPKAQKVVVYGPEGIGKTTLAAQFPDPLFVDVEGGSAHLDVARAEAPRSWAALLSTVDAVRAERPCATLVVDTADWAERLCAESICAKRKWDSIETPSYGKGYTELAEEFGRLLDKLTEVAEAGVNVVLAAHAAMRKFEQPDEAAPYDRWELKLQKKVAPLVKEWADAVLFINYKTIVETVGEGFAAKGKARGGKRVMYASHHACWDAKNRFGLPDEVPFDYASIAHCITGPASAPPAAPKPAAPTEKDILPPPSAPAAPAPQPKPQPESPRETVPEALLTPDLMALGVPEKLAALMSANNVTPEELQFVVGKRGYFPEDMPIRDYPADFVEGCLVAAWPQVLQMVLDNRDLPF